MEVTAFSSVKTSTTSSSQRPRKYRKSLTTSREETGSSSTILAAASSSKGPQHAGWVSLPHESEDHHHHHPGVSSRLQAAVAMTTEPDAMEMRRMLSSYGTATTIPIHQNRQHEWQIPQQSQSPTSTMENVTSWWMEHALPVLSAALLITGNTVGAGCLVLPELAQGPGLAATTTMLGVAYLLNLGSGLVLAQVAIAQKEAMNAAAAQEEDEDNASVPSSFQDFAAANLGSQKAAHVVSILSILVNACVLAFDFNLAGNVVGDMLSAGGAVAGNAAASTISVVWAAAVATALTTLSTPHVSLLCSVCVTALFVSFAGLLLPGLAAIPHSAAAAIFFQPGTDALDGSCWASAVHIFPIILMSMVFQNIVPVVVKLLNYHRCKTVAALALGSAIPLGMYTAWCYACLGGGIDATTTATAGVLLTVFSLATLGGSSLCSSMSLIEELDTFLAPNNDNIEIETKTTGSKTGDDGFFTPQAAALSDAAPTPDVAVADAVTSTGFPLPAALASVSIPLAAALLFGGGDDGLTGALSIAGSFGSPVLYGLVPALMAWQQQEKHQQQPVPSPLPMTPPFRHLVPSASLPLLGALSTGFVGHEMFSLVEQLALALAS